MAVAPASATTHTRHAAAADDPAGTVTLTPPGASDANDEVAPLAGSARWLVYRVTPPHAVSQLLARGVDGHITALGPDTLAYPGTGYPVDPFDYSMTGNTLVARALQSADLVETRDLATGAADTVLLPAGDHFLAAAPDGFLYAAGAEVFRRDLDGTVTDLGTPLGAAASVGAVTGDAGAMLYSDHAASYLPFTGSPTIRSLPIGVHKALRCDSVVGGYAGCQDFGPNGYHVLLVPLDGTRTPTRIASKSFPIQVALAGSTLLFLTGGSGYGNVVHSFGYGAKTASTSTYQVNDALVAAYGVVVAANASSRATSVLSLRAATTAPRTLLTAQPSPVTATSVSTGPGRLVAVDDRRVTGGRVMSSSVFGTAIATDAAPPTVGSTRLIKRGSYRFDALGYGTSTVYGLTNSASGYERRVLRAPRNSTTLTGTTPGAAATLSGNRLLYRTGEADVEGGKAYVYDVSTGRTTAEPTIGFFPDLAVSGQDLAYVSTGTGSTNEVRRKDLITGASVDVAPLPSGGYSPYYQVFSYGDYVGWDYFDDRSNEGQPSVSSYGYRDVKTMSPVVTLDQPIEQLSAAGITLSTQLNPDPDEVATYTLRTWAGTTIPLLPNAAYSLPPQITGATLAWGDVNSRVKVAPLDVPAVAPRFLGATIAPAALHSPGHVGWQAWAPFSEPLTSCSVVISRGSADVRRLPCNAALMTIGSANFSWDGRYGGHVAPAGTYRYRIVAAGRGGPVQNVFGDVAAPVAKISVG